VGVLVWRRDCDSSGSGGVAPAAGCLSLACGVRLGWSVLPRRAEVLDVRRQDGLSGGQERDLPGMFRNGS
jgi:hypothetical protein